LEAVINTYTFWTYFELELIEFQHLFEKCFEGLELRRDYENTWEWLEGRTKNDIYELNISRLHKWEERIYEKELTIIVKTNLNECEDTIAKRLKMFIPTTLFFGNRIYVKGTKYKYEIEKQY
jgi:hypothetical protein